MCHFNVETVKRKMKLPNSNVIPNISYTFGFTFFA